MKFSNTFVPSDCFSISKSFSSAEFFLSYFDTKQPIKDEPTELITFVTFAMPCIANVLVHGTTTPSLIPNNFSVKLLSAGGKSSRT